MTKLHHIIGFILLIIVGHACHKKVGLVSRNIQLVENYAYYFEGEQTLFAFYSFNIEGNLGSNGVWEWSTEEGVEASWQDLQKSPLVHDHRPGQCEPPLMCGSFSLQRGRWSENIYLRYRYDREGQDADTFAWKVFRMPRQSRSFVVFGAFADDQRTALWQGRHQFPDLDQEDVARFGLVRRFVVREPFALAMTLAPDPENPTLFSSVSNCPGLPVVDKERESADGSPVFSGPLLPAQSEENFSGVCAQAEIQSGRGPEKATTFARRNPVVETIPGKLGVKVAEASPVDLVLTTCRSDEATYDYLSYQKRQLLMPSSVDTLCWDSPNLRNDFFAVINRLLGPDKGFQKYLRLVWNHKLEGLQREAYEATLDGILLELGTNYPSLSGIFVYDSSLRVTRNPALFRYTVWCRLASLDDEDRSEYCGLALSSRNSDPSVSLDTNLFPTYQEYGAQRRRFEDRSTRAIQVYAPLRSEGVRYLPLGPLEGGELFGTFFAGDQIPLQGTEQLSYCNQADRYGSLAFLAPEDLSKPQLKPYGPIAALGEHHRQRRGPATYQIGMWWTNPFLMAIELDEKLRVNPIVKAILNLPNSLGSQLSFGEELWYEGEYNYSGVLTRCLRYCDHPAFDGTGVYRYESTWTLDYQTACYQPRIPQAPALGGDEL